MAHGEIVHGTPAKHQARHNTLIIDAIYDHLVHAFTRKSADDDGTIITDPNDGTVLGKIAAVEPLHEPGTWYVGGLRVVMKDARRSAFRITITQDEPGVVMARELGPPDTPVKMDHIPTIKQLPPSGNSPDIIVEATDVTQDQSGLDTIRDDIKNRD